MHKIDSTGATGDSKFTDGNPAQGIPATVLDAAFMNAVQEELINVLSAAGITPVKGTWTQLRDSITNIAPKYAVTNTDPIIDIQPLTPTGITWSGSVYLKPIRLPAPYNYWFMPGIGGYSNTSSDGKTWTQRTNIADKTWRGSAYSSSLGRLVIVASNISGGLNCQTSDDGGVTFTNRTHAAIDNINLRDIAWSATLNLFCAVGGISSNRIVTSPDGITWAVRTTTFPDSMYVVAWSPSLSKFVAIGDNYINTSTDGISWAATAITPEGSNPGRLIWIPEVGLFVLLWCSGTCWVSADGTTWQIRGRAFSSTMTQGTINLNYDHTNRTILANTNGVANSVSFDLGVSWQSIPSTTLPVTNSPFQLLYSDGIFHQVTNSSTYSRLINLLTVAPTKFYAGDRFPTSPAQQDFYLNKLTGETWRYLNGWKKLTAKIGGSSVATRAVTTWTARSASANSDWRAVCYSRERKLFVAVASFGTGRVMTSTDAVTWTGRTEAAANGWYNVVWSPELGLFVSLAFDGMTSNNCMTSPDGVTWTSRTTPAVQLWYGLCWSSNLQVFVAVSGDGASYRCMTSFDGITWAAVTSSVALASAWSSICWSQELGLFVAVATSGTDRVMTSPDSITWTARSAAAANSWRSVTWSPELGLFVAVSSDGTNRVMTSPDGTTWTARSAANAVQWWKVEWAAELGLFVAVASDGTTAQQIMTSPDGVNWTARTSSEATSWRGLCWAKDLGLFVGVSQAGTNRVMSSTFVGTVPQN